MELPLHKDAICLLANYLTDLDQINQILSSLTERQQNNLRECIKYILTGKVTEKDLKRFPNLLIVREDIVLDLSGEKRIPLDSIILKNKLEWCTIDLSNLDYNFTEFARFCETFVKTHGAKNFSFLNIDNIDGFEIIIVGKNLFIRGCIIRTIHFDYNVGEHFWKKSDCTAAYFTNINKIVCHIILDKNLNTEDLPNINFIFWTKSPLVNL